MRTCCPQAKFLTQIIVAALFISQAGCLWIAAGAAGGAAALGYMYCKGRVCDRYNAGFADTWAATHASLAELGMPILKETREQSFEGTIECRADGDKVQVAIVEVPSPLPEEGTMTQVCVRVATFGDPSVSERILNQIGSHLVAAGPGTGPGQLSVPHGQNIPNAGASVVPPAAMLQSPEPPIVAPGGGK
jgi:hypothetical protein